MSLTKKIEFDMEEEGVQRIDSVPTKITDMPD